MSRRPHPPPMQWPPLISPSRLPRVVLVRDAALTAAAWFVFGILCADAISLLEDYLRYGVAGPARIPLPDWPAIWEALRAFVAVAAVLVAWLIYWAVARARRVRATGLEPQPPALTLAEHAAAYAIPESDLAGWRTLRIATVHFDAAGRIGRIEAAPDGPPTAAVPR